MPHKVLSLQSNAVVSAEKKKDPKLLWKRLQEHVIRGQYRNFLFELAQTQNRYESKKHGLLKLPSNFLIDDDDTAEDKFTKLVVQQIVKKRAEDSSKTNATGAGSSNLLSGHDAQMRDEAYDMALKCLVFPLLDHRNLMKSQDDISQQKQQQQQDNHGVGAFGKSLISNIIGGGNEKQPKMSERIFKLVKEKISQCLAANEKNPKRDNVYFNTIAKFYHDVIKKRSASFIFSGSTADDMFAVFSKILTGEFEERLASLSSSPEDTKNFLKPYQNETEAIVARLQLFRDMLHACVEEASTDEMLHNHNKKRRSHNKIPHHMKGESQDRTSIKTGGARSSHKNQSSTDGHQLQDIADEMPSNSGGSSHLSQEVVIMTEWLKDSFGMNRSSHQDRIHKISLSSKVPKVIVADFEARLTQVEADIAQEIYSPPLSTTYEGINEKSFEEGDIFTYWKKTEQQDLKKYISRMRKLYLDQDDTKTVDIDSVPSAGITVTSPAEDQDKWYKQKNRVCKIKVRVVEAKGLLSKDENGLSDPYVVVEHGKKQRYQTEVVSNSLMPLWDQEITLLVKTNSKKPIELSVWDADEEENEEQPVSPFSSKFWRDEADDFLGMLSFKVPELLEQLDNAKDKRIEMWFPLQKRSKRSHVSGEIRVALEFDQDMSSLSGHQLAVADSTSNELIEVNPSIAETESKESVFKLNTFQSSSELYGYLLEKFLETDIRNGLGEYGVGSLSMASESILIEVAVKLRLHKVQREMIYFHVFVNRYMNIPVNRTAIPAMTLSQIYTRFEHVLNQSKQTMKEVRVMCPLQVDYAPDGKKIVNPPVVSGSGDAFTKQDLEKFEQTVAVLFEYLKVQVQRYKDNFPCDTPAGALASTLFVLDTLYHSDYVDTKKESENSYTDLLSSLVKCGTLERLTRLSELAMPMTQEDDSTKRIVKLSQLVLDELDADQMYFQKPFAADIDVVGISTEIYLKHLMLEIQDLVARMTPSKHAQLRKPEVISNSIFDLYYIIRDIQTKYKSYIKDSNLKEEFSVHGWFSACVHNWLLNSESKLMDWANNAIKMDKFEPLDAEDNILHSTSIIDLFFCVRQMLECLKKLDWQTKEGDNDSALETEEDQKSREYQWALFVTRYSLLLSRAMSKYCEILSNQVNDAQVKHAKVKKHAGGVFANIMDEGKFSLDSALGLGNSKKKKAVESMPMLKSHADNPQREWLSDSEETKKICVRLNNLEAAREQVNELFESLKIESILETLSSKSKAEHKTTSNDQLNNDTVSGYLSLKIVMAEDLVSCDTNGSSDPYCVISVSQKSSQYAAANGIVSPWNTLNPWNESSTATTDSEIKQIAKSKVVEQNLNPRWDEGFTAVLRGASVLHVTVYDYDLIGKDSICGSASIPINTIRDALSEVELHDLWVDLKPQGRVLLRLEFEKVKGMENFQLADPDFYFRRALRELKRYSGDLLEIMARSMGEVVARELTRIVKEAEQSSGKSLFSFASKSHDEPPKPVSIEEVETEMNTVTDYMNAALATLSRQLYPRLWKELLKKTWKEILNIVEELLVPHLYGNNVISRLGRSKPLGQRQLQMLTQSLLVLKEFMYADGSDVGLSLKVLESEEYNQIQEIIEYYPKDKDTIKARIHEKINGDSEKRSVDGLLKIMRLRLSEKDKYMEEQMQLREHRLKAITASGIGASQSLTSLNR